MSATSVWIIALCLWGLTNCWWLPLMKQRWQAGDLRVKVARAGVMAVLEKIRDLSAVALITFTLVILLVWLCQLLANVSFATPKFILACISSFYELAKDITEHYSTSLEIFGLVGAIVVLTLAARQARRAVSHAWIAEANEVYRRIRSDPQSELDGLAKDPEFAPIVGRLSQLAKVLDAHGDASKAARPSESDAAAAKREIDRILQHLAIEQSRKSLKLEEILKAPTPSEPASNSVRQRLTRMLFSERLFKDLGLVKKRMSFASTALLFLALTGWSAAPMANTLQLAVNNLRVNVEKAQATRDLEGALSEAKAAASKAPPPSAPVTAQEIRAVTQLIARATARQLVRSPDLIAQLDTRRSPLAEGEYVRAHLAAHDLEPASHAAVINQIRFEVNQGIPRDADRLDPGGALQDRLENDVYAQVEALAKDNRPAFERVRDALLARYSGTAAPLESEGRLVESLLDNSFEAVDVESTSEVGKEAQKLLKEFGKKAVQTWADTAAERLASNLILGAVHNNVMAAAQAQFSFMTSSETREFVENLREAGGTGWVASAKVNEDVEIDRKVAAAIAATTGDDSESRAALEARLGGYDRLFPLGTLADDTPPPAGADAGGGGGGGGGGRSKAGPSVGEDAVRAAEGGAARAEVSAVGESIGRVASFGESRAASFLLSARSFRVRGVLVGRDLATDGISVDDLKWMIVPAGAASTTKVRLDIRRNGEWLQLGAFDAGIVNQAIRYAADRRVVATTITPGDGKITGRLTYLHPVLANTPLGCRIVEVDRLVDTFSASDTAQRPHSSIDVLASDRHAMWEWLNMMSLGELVAEIPSSAQCQEDELSNALVKRRVQEPHFSAALSEATNRFLEARESKTPGSTRVIRAVQACTKGPSSQVAHCLCGQVAGTASSGAYWMPEDHTSQFREREIVLGSDMKWIQRSPDRMSNIDLWVHTTFALHIPSKTGGDSVVDEASAIALDFPPDELNTLRSVVLAGLPEYISTRVHSASYDDFLAPVEDFVLIQRLMRAGLGGSLGAEFPMAKVMKLESDTRAFVPSQPTIKWESGAGGEELLVQTLAAADVRAGQSYATWRRDVIDRSRQRRALCDSASL